MPGTPPAPDLRLLSDCGVHDLRIAVEEFLRERGHDEIVLVYLSCHGVLNARRRLYFAARDTDRDKPASTGLDAQWLIERLGWSRAEGGSC